MRKRIAKDGRPQLATIAVAVVVAMALAGAALLGLGRTTTYTGSAVNPSATGPVSLTPEADRRPAEPLAFNDSAGRTLTLDDFRGRAVLVNLWATWCGPCIAEMPALDALEAHLGGPRFQVVAVAIDHGGIATAQAWLERNGIGHLARYAGDPARFPNALLPTTLLIDRNGRVAWTGLGARAWGDPQIQAEIARLIGE